MELHKKQMQEAAILYYEKKHTQNEVAKIMNLSRQTVSKLLSDAEREGIVEVRIQNPEIALTELENKICAEFKIENAVICGVSRDNEELCLLMTVKKAAAYIERLIKSGNKKIGISWGRTIERLIGELNYSNASNNVVFPLFGATDREQACFLSNELARSFADRIGAEIKYAWFPYRPDSVKDCELFKNTSYYKRLCDLWNDIDVAVIGIGNSEIIRTFGKIFGYREKCSSVIGDVATHFFDADGRLLDIYENTLCASKENLKNAKETIAVASGENKAEAIVGALKTGIIDTLIIDEYTAKRILSAD